MENIKVLTEEEKDLMGQEFNEPRRIKLADFKLEEIRNKSNVSKIQEPISEEIEIKEEPVMEVSLEPVIEEKVKMPKFDEVSINDYSDKKVDEEPKLYGGLSLEDSSEVKRMEEAGKEVESRYKDHFESIGMVKPDDKSDVRTTSVSKEDFEKMLNTEIKDSEFAKAINNKKVIYFRHKDELNDLNENIDALKENRSNTSNSIEDIKVKNESRNVILKALEDKGNFGFLSIRKDEDNAIKEAWDELNSALGKYRDVVESVRNSDLSKANNLHNELNRIDSDIARFEKESAVKEDELEKYVEKTSLNVKLLIEKDNDKNDLLMQSNRLDTAYGIDKLNQNNERSVMAGPSTENSVQGVEEEEKVERQAVKDIKHYGGTEFQGFDSLRESVNRGRAA